MLRGSPQVRPPCEIPPLFPKLEGEAVLSRAITAGVSIPDAEVRGAACRLKPVQPAEEALRSRILYRLQPARVYVDAALLRGSPGPPFAKATEAKRFAPPASQTAQASFRSGLAAKSKIWDTLYESRLTAMKGMDGTGE